MNELVLLVLVSIEPHNKFRMLDDLVIQPSDEKPLRADAVRNRELLLDSARKLFDKHGVSCVSMSAIAQEAEVGKGTLYRHFRDKAELCHALLDTDMHILQDNTLQYLGRDESPVDKLRWFLVQVVQFVDTNQAFLQETSTNTGMIMLEHPAHVWWRQTIIGLLIQMNIPSSQRPYIADTLYVMVDVQTIRFQYESLGYSRADIMAGLNMLVDQLVVHL